MEYKGFISDLVLRSEELLAREVHDNLSVTRLLLIMNTGFSLVSERIRFWDDLDKHGSTDDNPWRKVNKVLKGNLGKSITVDDAQYFEDFRTCDDWAFRRFETDKQKLSSSKVLGMVDNGELRSINELKVKSIVTPLRNSFAHGGILPISPRQVSHLPSERKVLRPHSGPDGSQIDRVYFVSKWTEDNSKGEIDTAAEFKGYNVLVFGLTALQAFWDDWRNLLVSEGQALSQLDRAA